MNTIFFAHARESRIRSFIALYQYVPTSIIRRKFFDFPSGERKCRQVLQRMVERKLLRRFMHNEYIYHMDSRSSQWLHTHKVSMFHFDLLASLKHMHQEIIYHKREYSYGPGRADGLYIVKLQEDGRGVKFFLEVDDGANEFDKVQKYELCRQGRDWKWKFWADPLKTGTVSFPLVLVVTDRPIPGSDIVTVRACKPGSNYLEVLTNGS